MLEVVDFTVSYEPVAGTLSLFIITEIASAEGLIIFWIGYIQCLSKYHFTQRRRNSISWLTIYIYMDW